LATKTLIKEKRKESGIRRKRILFGKKINKIKAKKRRKVKRPIRNGKRIRSCLFLK